MNDVPDWRPSAVRYLKYRMRKIVPPPHRPRYVEYHEALAAHVWYAYGGRLVRGVLNVVPPGRHGPTIQIAKASVRVHENGFITLVDLRTGYIHLRPNGRWRFMRGLDAAAWRDLQNYLEAQRIMEVLAR